MKSGWRKFSLHRVEHKTWQVRVERLRERVGSVSQPGSGQTLLPLRLYRVVVTSENHLLGQKIRTREVYQNLLHLVQGLFAQGRTCEPVLEVIMPV